MTPVSWARLAPVGRWGRLLLVFPAACAVFTVVILMYLQGLFDPATAVEAWADALTLGGGLFIVVLTAYNLLGPLALAALVSIGSRLTPRAMGVVTAGCGVYTAALGYSLIEMITDESSTAVLLLLFLPLYLGVLLLPFAAAAALVQRFRSRAAARDGRAGGPVVVD
ncbi:hypothetical protein [uncultured Friedmanniella sp.]|uniref:hypothetical protein n=1 Tax=uncultured Friedmanniella sp. TaxID=335381 RepID=UPI0035CAA049